MKRTNRILMAAMVAGVAGSATAQQSLTSLWKTDAGGSLAWFANDNATRGAGFNAATGNLLVANRNGLGNVVRRLNGATGAEVTPFLPQTYSGGTFPLNKVNVAGDGKIYVTNLGGGAASIFKIYQHADETTGNITSFTSPVMAAATDRLGDDAAITGSGNGTKIIASGSGNPTVIIYSTVDGGATFTAGTPITPGTQVGSPQVTFDTNGVDFWIRKASATSVEVTTASLYTPAGGAATLSVIAATGAGMIDVKDLNGRKVMATGPAALAAASTGVKVNINQVGIDEASSTLLYQSGSIEAGVSSNANGNGTGDVAIDTAGKRLYAVWTNNSISGWSIPNLTGVADWNLY